MASNLGQMRRMLNGCGFWRRFLFFFFFFLLMIFVDCVLIEVQFISNVVYKKRFYSLGEGEGCSMCDQVWAFFCLVGGELTR